MDDIPVGIHKPSESYKTPVEAADDHKNERESV